jgi:hypothetical protein
MELHHMDYTVASFQRTHNFRDATVELPFGPGRLIGAGTFGQIITKTGSRALAGQIRLEF